MEGRALAPPDPSSSAKSSEMVKPSTVMDYLSNEWTNEKHSLYLNSIEASFVNQFYCSEHPSSGIKGWLSITQKMAISTQSNSNERQAGQFKVPRRGCIQHSRSQSIGKLQKTSCGADGNDFASQSSNFSSPVEAKKTSENILRACYPLVFQQDPVNSRTEGSDQNFDDLEHELAEETSKACSKRKSGRSCLFIDK